MSKQYKLVVTVPETDGDMLRKAIGEAGGGRTGDYSHCSFTVKGIGRFKPENGATPTIGSIGESTEVIEERIEVNCDDESLENVRKAILAVHPYETPIIDIYPLLER